jgi:integrating conjugative element protein (TIGR03758 family)
MTISADQFTAFQSYSGFTPSACANLILAAVFAVLLLWGIWALRTAYSGWAEQRLSHRQFLAVGIRFVAMYVVLSFFLLS